MLVPSPPKGLKPGIISLVMIGRPVMGDVAVTLVDLVRRGALDAEAEDDADWTLTPAPTAAASQSLAGYETRLLKSLSPSGRSVRLTCLSTRLESALQGVRRALIREGVARGWVRRMHHDQRTPEGEQLLRRVQSFRRELRRYKSETGDEAVTGALLPFALRFGLISGDRLPLARFAHDWVRTLADMPGWAPVQPARPVYDDYGPLFPRAHILG